MKIYQTKIKKFPGTEFGEVHEYAVKTYKAIKSKTKRRPYVRSAYFKKEKVFLDYFWSHMHQKNWRDRTRRLKYYACAIDLLKHSQMESVSKQNPNKPQEILHRFAGMTPDKELFYVQIREDKKTDRKDFMSVYPVG